MTYKCPRCAARGKDWEGDDPKCGFDENGNFLNDNWNCATLNELRRVGHFMLEANQHRVMILEKEEVGHGIITWYKNRAGTEDFRDGYFNQGTLKYAQQLLGDVEPDGDFYE